MTDDRKVQSLVTTDDWYVINEIVKEINKSGDSHEARQAVLDRIGEIIPFTKGSFMLGSIGDGYIDYFDPVLVNETIENLQSYTEVYQHYDPMNVFYLQSDEIAYIDSDYVNETMAKTSKLYQEWFWPNGMYYMLGSKLTYNGIFLGSTLLTREKSDVDFTMREKEILRIISEHLAYRIYNFYPNGITKEGVEVGGDPVAINYGFSTREMEVVNLIRQGLTAKEIADALCISEFTVKRHANNIYRKAGVNSKAQLIALLSK